ncbi:MAG: HDIG domain-containing protein [Leptospiraceae bacterium]|nr:HDIG domain-containing protein [Leptospiraceae bacterium]MCP5495473.1 HDIG domain-containing protein [Leptospiraceae bacterium]
MANITDSLTKTRPVLFVRKLQFILLLITLIIVTLILAAPHMGQARVDLSPNGLYAVGNISPETIVSSREIIYVDIEKTEAERAKAYQSGSFVFERDYDILTDKIHSGIEEDFENLKEIAGFNHSQQPVKLIKEKNPRWRNRSNSDLDILITYPQKNHLKDLVHQSVNLLFSTNCVIKENLPDIKSVMQFGGIIINKSTNENPSILDGNHIFERTALYQNNAINAKLTKLIENKLKNIDAKILSIIQKLSFSYIYSYPACVFSKDATENEKISQKEKIAPIKAKITTNETIVRKGGLITPEIRTKLKALNLYATRANISSIFSILIVQITLVAIVLIFLKKYANKKLIDVSSNLIIFSLIWFVLLYTFIAAKIYFNPEKNYDSVYYFAIFIPTGMICLLIGFIFDELIAVVIGFYLTFFIFLLSKSNPTTFMIAFTTSVISSTYGPRIKKRIDFLKAGAFVTLAMIFLSASGYLIDSKTYWVDFSSGSFLADLYNSNVFSIFSMCVLMGFAGATVAQFLLPIYEYIFNIPTRFKLQELADTGHPLLQQLLTKAPSTYTHTFMVSALSERAAQNLGLDWLLTRVGVYYHDIGKIPNAGFFAENQHLIPKKENIDKNNPGLAAKIIIDHVIDGLEMAKKARLPREIIDFIPEHHGTSTMAFFYHRALASFSPKYRKKIKKSDFMYPGPKPQRKETAIVMIADSVEAASRSLDEITPQSLEDLIQKIINIKLAENQLDESGLTIGDLAIIKSSFKEILLSSLHQRPKYPSTEETKKLEESQNVPNGKKKAGEVKQAIPEPIVAKKKTASKKKPSIAKKK